MRLGFKKIIVSALLVYSVAFISVSRFGLGGAYFAPYAEKGLEESKGSTLLDQKYEEEIRSIAKEVGLTTPFHIRRMNRRALLTWGYHNAFVQYATFFGIPVGVPYLFASQGLFEDISPEERRFLIGHELMHIKLGHIPSALTLSYVLNLFLALIFLILFFNFGNNNLKSLGSRKYLNFKFISPKTLLFLVLVIASDAISIAYRRYNEWDADCNSVKCLASADGGLRLINRWQIEFNLPEHNSWCGIFSSHPSCAERRKYISEI